MEFSIEYIEESGIILTTVRGVLTIQNVSEVLSAQHEMSEKKKCDRLLSDLRDAELRAATSQMFSAAEWQEKMGLPRRMKKAIVYTKPGENVQFLEDVLVNRGWAVRIFKDMDEAKAWLLE